MKILNLTIHSPTSEQAAAGVVDLPPELAEMLRSYLDFRALPSAPDLARRAEKITMIAAGSAYASGADRAMIGSGHPALLPFLEEALIRAGIRPVYAFSVLETVEEALPDGGVKKTAVFRHIGFVEPYAPPPHIAAAEMYPPQCEVCGAIRDGDPRLCAYCAAAQNGGGQ